MFFTYLRRELRRRRKAALVVASGLALGIALVIVVSSVSSGMEKAQGKVLQSLYGLGTDMTVTKAAQAQSSTGERPRFQFDARGSDSDEEQSSDRVMVQGFQTLAASTVSKVGAQKGVSDVVGGLSLQVVKVSGQFRRGEFQQDQQNGGRQPQGGAEPGAGQSAEGRVQGGGADFDVNNYSVYGTDVTKPALGPLTSSKITSGRTFKSSETDAKVVVADTSYAKEKKLALGDTVTIKSVKYKVIGIATPDSGDAAANLYIPLKQAQTLSDSKDKVTTIYVKASDSQQISAVKSTIQKNISGTTVTTSADLADTVSGSLSTASDLASNVGKWLSIAVLVAAFLVAGLLTSSAVSRRVTGVRHPQGARLEVRPRHPAGRRRGRRQRAGRRRPRYRARLSAAPTSSPPSARRSRPRSAPRAGRSAAPAVALVAAWAARPARSSRAPPAVANPPSSRCSADSTGPPRAASNSTARILPDCPRPN